MFRVFSGKFCDAIDRKPEGFVWAITLSDLTLPDDQEPISHGISPTMNEALKDAYCGKTSQAIVLGNLQPNIRFLTPVPLFTCFDRVLHRHRLSPLDRF